MLQPQTNPPTYAGAPSATQALPSTGNQGQFRTSPGPMSGPMSGGLGGTQAAPAFAPSFDAASLPAPMPMPPGPAYTPQPMAASGGGGGRAVAIVLLLVLVLGGGGAAAFFFFGHKAASSNASDSGVAAAIVPDAAGTGAAPTQTVAPLEPLIVDAGHEPPRTYVQATTNKTSSTTTSTPGIPAPPLPPTVRCPVAACGESAAARARGHVRQANALAATCRAAGCVAP
jgi:hypothetical protein